MDRRRFLKTAAGLFVPAIPAIIRPERALAQLSGGVGGFPGPGTAHSTGTGLRTSLSAFFELDNSGGNGLVDSTGTITNLTNNATTTFVSDTIGGVSANVANFVAASSQYLSHANSSTLAINSANFSLSFWIKLNSFPGAFISQETTAFPQQGWNVQRVFTSSNIFRVVETNNSAGGSSADGSVGLSTATWYLVIYTYNATTLVPSISVNNSAFVAGSAAGANPSGETGQFNIGSTQGVAPSGFLDGRMCRIGKWTGRLLNTTDVGLLWNGGAGLTYAGMA